MKQLSKFLSALILLNIFVQILGQRTLEYETPWIVKPNQLGQHPSIKVAANAQTMVPIHLII